MMNVVTDFAVFMNKTIYPLVFLGHTFLIGQILYYKYILPSTIPSTYRQHFRDKIMRFHWWVPKYIWVYCVYALFNIPFFIWYECSYGRFWYFSHFLYIHYHMYGIACLVVAFIHHKELNITPEFMIKYTLYYIIHMLWSGWVLFACVNGCDEEFLWQGWMEEDLYRFNNLPPDSFDWRLDPVTLQPVKKP
jgi:hypothetical protein